MRLDLAVARTFGLSRRAARDAVRAGRVDVSGRTVDEPGTDVEPETKVELHASRPARRRVRARLSVLHEDGDVIIVDKPAGLLTVPTEAREKDTLWSRVLFYLQHRYGGRPYAGIVHRLDKDTSGLMVVARSMRAHTTLVEQLSERDVHRQYAAVVYGKMVAGGSIDAAIGRHPRDRLKQAVREDGRHALTHYRVRERFRSLTLIECRLETGRTHQIRVHMAHARHPLVGDPQYGGGLRLPKGATPGLVEALRGFRRQALHAERLEFAHPADGRTIAVEAELPADMASLVEALREDTRAGGA